MTKSSHQFSSSVSNIKINYEIAKGLEKWIEDKLSISFSPSMVAEIMDKIHLIEESCVEQGIDIARNNWDQKAKERLWKARRER